MSPAARSLKVLVLAGTSEATQLAAGLVGAGYDVVSSLAGVTTSPRPRAGATRRGGFGGAEGLARFLHEERVDLVIDATHPHAAVMPFNAAEACRRCAVPLCRLLREPWRAVAGDRWTEVDDMARAAAALQALGARRVFLAVGRQSLEPFSACHQQWFLVRSIEEATTSLDRAAFVLDRGPFTYDGERRLLADHRIDTIVTKNAGGNATAAKLAAGRDLGLAVVMVARPPAPVGTPTVTTVQDALAWALAAR